MKNLLRVSVLALVIVFLFSACAKKPETEMSAAENAIQVITKAGADIYASSELKSLKDTLAAATEEVNAQGKKLFKKYSNAKEMLLKVKTDAEGLTAVILTRKEEAKNKAITLQGEATAAVDEATAILLKAPRGKGTRADIEAFQADLKGLSGSLAEIQTAIDSEDYFGAADKASVIKEKATAISDQIKQAIEKVKKR